jgi:peroxiredoxin/predicted 2-oxoglutarate/Fe(II)-dependent dioxygenase YbiX
MNEQAPKDQYIALTPGDPAPWFHQRSTGTERYAFDSTAGRYIVLCFLMSAAHPSAQAALSAVAAHRAQFDDQKACFFGVSIDPSDEKESRLKESIPGIRHFWDFDGTVSRLYGALPKDAAPGGQNLRARQFWMVLDPKLRVMAVFPLAEHEAVFSFLAELPPPARHLGFEVQAPILVIPNVFEQDFCRHLIGLYDQHGGTESGIMRESEGKTVAVSDHAFKRRKDYELSEPEVIKRIQRAILRRVNPELQKCYCFNATRMERYIVSCYAAEDAAHFRPHRDNTTKGTAHRCFAVSINLNSDFEGGELSFPEYGPRSFKAPPGGAVVFPGALLHAVSRVTAGRRYAFLPFVYDEAAAKLREENAKFLAGSGSNYRA